MNKRALEGLVKSGALASTGNNRSSLLQSIDTALEYGSSYQREKNSNQMSLFGAESPTVKHRPTVHEIDELNQGELLQQEKEMLGLFLSDHPLKKWINLFEEIMLPSIEEIKDDDFQFNKLYIGAILLNLKIKSSKKTKELYAEITLEDIEGRIDAVLFPQSFAKYKDILVRR